MWWAEYSNKKKMTKKHRKAEPDNPQRREPAKPARPRLSITQPMHSPQDKKIMLQAASVPLESQKMLVGSLLHFKRKKNQSQCFFT